jgi:hypothetical protein
MACSVAFELETAQVYMREADRNSFDACQMVGSGGIAL